MAAWGDITGSWGDYVGVWNPNTPITAQIIYVGKVPTLRTTKTFIPVVGKYRLLGRIPGLWMTKTFYPAQAKLEYLTQVPAFSIAKLVRLNYVWNNATTTWGAIAGSWGQQTLHAKLSLVGQQPKAAAVKTIKPFTAKLILVHQLPLTWAVKTKQSVTAKLNLLGQLTVLWMTKTFYPSQAKLDYIGNVAVPNYIKTVRLNRTWNNSTTTWGTITGSWEQQTLHTRIQLLGKIPSAFAVKTIIPLLAKLSFVGKTTVVFATKRAIPFVAKLQLTGKVSALWNTKTFYPVAGKLLFIGRSSVERIIKTVRLNLTWNNATTTWGTIPGAWNQQTLHAKYNLLSRLPATTTAQRVISIQAKLNLIGKIPTFRTVSVTTPGNGLLSYRTGISIARFGATVKLQSGRLHLSGQIPTVVAGFKWRPTDVSEELWKRI